MPLITNAGVGSGLNLEGIISATVQAEDTPKRSQFVQKDTRLNLELSGVGAVKSALSTLDSAVKKLADEDNFNNRTSTVTQPESGDLISVSTTSNSTPGDFDIEVKQLAQGSRAVSNDGLYNAPTDVVTASGGKLTIGAGAESFEVTLSAGATLEDLRDAINDAGDNFGLSVNIVNTGGITPQSKLVFSSSITGKSNDLTITGDTAELDNVTTTALGGGAGGLTIAVEDAAQDAIIEVDGIVVNSDTNKFKDAVQDMTITVLKESENNETANVSVDYDKETVTKTIDEFISAFNNVISVIDQQTGANGALSGDSSMRSLKNQLITSLSSEITGAGNFTSIFDLGLGLASEKVGASRVTTLEKSNVVGNLSENLDSFYADVGKAFSGAGGLATQFSTLLDGYVKSDGALKFREDAIGGEIRQLEDDVANHEYRMEQLEVRLRQQYSALDVLVAQLQSSGQFLTSQLASLPGFTSPKS